MIIAVQALAFFSETLFTIIEHIARPFYKFFLPFTKNDDVSDGEESDVHVFADYDEEKGVVFYPPVYAQRYAAVVDCLIDERWCGKLAKVVDMGCHDITFVKYLKEIPGINTVLSVDIEPFYLECSASFVDSKDQFSKRKSPLQLKLLEGNAADPDYRLIGCDAVIAIEMIEHMLPHDLERLVHTIFGFIKPWVAVITTPNGDFNPLFKALEANNLRRLDHFFEWSREQFNDWCSNIVLRYPQYTVSCKGIAPGPPGTEQYGCCSQLALFTAKEYHKQQDLSLNSLALVAEQPADAANILESLDSDPNIDNSDGAVSQNKLNCSTLHVKKFSTEAHNLMARNNKSNSPGNMKEILEELKEVMKMLNVDKKRPDNFNDSIWNNINWGDNAPYWNDYYKIIQEFTYPLTIQSDEKRILDLISEEINMLSESQYYDDFNVSNNKLAIPIEHLMKVVRHITDDEDGVRDLLEWNGYEVDDGVVIYERPLTLAASDDEDPSSVVII